MAFLRPLPRHDVLAVRLSPWALAALRVSSLLFAVVGFCLWDIVHESDDPKLRRGALWDANDPSAPLLASMQRVAWCAMSVGACSMVNYASYDGTVGAWSVVDFGVTCICAMVFVLECARAAAFRVCLVPSALVVWLYATRKHPNDHVAVHAAALAALFLWCVIASTAP